MQVRGFVSMYGDGSGTETEASKDLRPGVLCNPVSLCPLFYGSDIIVEFGELTIP